MKLRLKKNTVIIIITTERSVFAAGGARLIGLRATKRCTTTGFTIILFLYNLMRLIGHKASYINKCQRMYFNIICL